jgi:murein DD-endopeptidase MepM/ murein hydrolase activator NlpD
MNSPYKGRLQVTQPFGAENLRYSGGVHRGIDLVPKTKDRVVYATTSGRVTYAGWDVPRGAGFGIYVCVMNDNKKHYYAHLAEAYVTGGQPVGKGDRIGMTGSTGASTGPHLHYEIRSAEYKDQRYNPAVHIGIHNILGIYDVIDDGVPVDERINLSMAEAAKIVQESAGLTDGSMEFMYKDYRYGNDLIWKLGMAIANSPKEGDRDLSVAEAFDLVQERAGLSNETMQYIHDDYRWGDDLVWKLGMEVANGI